MRVITEKKIIMLLQVTIIKETILTKVEIGGEMKKICLQVKDSD